MDLKLEDRICLVTGASSGIGRATARILAAEGARVVLTARTLDALKQLTEEIEALGGEDPVSVAADLAGEDSADPLLEEVLSRVGRIDVLVNAAGGSRPMDRPDDEAAWSEALRLNFHSPRRLGDRLAPMMASRGWGRIVNVTGAIVGKSCNAAAPAKAALESWAKGASAVHARHGVTVNCVAPGRLNTRQILEKLHPDEASRRAYIERNIPAGYFGEPEDAAAVIAFLSSEQARYVTGVTIPVDGGTMRYAF
ncbi:MAG: SDR family oxidoreductase [Xanthobacteraceae bacterium]|nr:SDR family oxidoreductase [Xanthobacteraceae bacterium]